MPCSAFVHDKMAEVGDVPSGIEQLVALICISSEDSGPACLEGILPCMQSAIPNVTQLNVVYADTQAMHASQRTANRNIYGSLTLM